MSDRDCTKCKWFYILHKDNPEAQCDFLAGSCFPNQFDKLPDSVLMLMELKKFIVNGDKLDTEETLEKINKFKMVKELSK